MNSSGQVVDKESIMVLLFIKLEQNKFVFSDTIFHNGEYFRIMNISGLRFANICTIKDSDWQNFN